MDTREKLIDAAAKCLLENGCHATCVKAVAETAGVNHGLVHHYFGSKEGLFIELAKKSFENIKPASDFTLESEEDIICYLKDRIVPSLRMMLELRSMSFHMPELHRHMADLAIELRSILVDFLHIEEETAFILMGSVLGLGFHSFLEPSIDIEKHIQIIVTILLDDKSR